MGHLCYERADKLWWFQWYESGPGDSQKRGAAPVGPSAFPPNTCYADAPYKAARPAFAAAIERASRCTRDKCLASKRRRASLVGVFEKQRNARALGLHGALQKHPSHRLCGRHPYAKEHLSHASQRAGGRATIRFTPLDSRGTRGRVGTLRNRVQTRGTPSTPAPLCRDARTSRGHNSEVRSGLNTVSFRNRSLYARVLQVRGARREGVAIDYDAPLRSGNLRFMRSATSVKELAGRLKLHSCYGDTSPCAVPPLLPRLHRPR